MYHTNAQKQIKPVFKKNVNIVLIIVNVNVNRAGKQVCQWSQSAEETPQTDVIIPDRHPNTHMHLALYYSMI